MKTGEAEIWLKNELSSIYPASEAGNIADLALEHLTGLSRADRMLKRDEPFNVHQLHHLTEIHHRLLHHEPIQYALGEAWFYGMKLFVDKSVLIPRPETEELVDWIVKDIKAAGKDVFERRGAEADETTSLKILDVGTGSGCIALALKKAMPKAEVWGCDLSDDALNIARRNGSQLDIRVDFVGLDFLDEAQVKQLPTVNIIVSNPPYIPEKDKEQMRSNVLDFEPHLALFVYDQDPLLFYHALANAGSHRLYPDGAIYAEIHEDYGPQVQQLFEEKGYEVVLKKDMQGKDRMIKAEKK